MKAKPIYKIVDGKGRILFHYSHSFRHSQDSK